MFHLVITQPFGSYEVGNRVTDQGEIALLEEAHRGKFVRVLAEEEPAQPVEAAPEQVAEEKAAAELPAPARRRKPAPQPVDSDASA